MDAIVIFITCANRKEALRLAGALVEKKLAACVNIVDKIESVFFWEGKREQIREALLIIKSRKRKLAGIIKLVKSIHSYQIPEIIALPVIAGYRPYLKWVDECLNRKSR